MFTDKILQDLLLLALLLADWFSHEKVRDSNPTVSGSYLDAQAIFGTRSSAYQKEKPITTLI